MKVCFVYAGPLKYRGRLFKQVKTLQDAGHECVLIHGRTEAEQPDYSAYSFHVIPIRVIWEKAKLVTLASILLFNRRAANNILDLDADAVVCITLESAMSGALAKRRDPSLRYIFDNNELALETFVSQMKTTVFGGIQDFVLKHADVVIHANSERLEYFGKRYPNDARPFVLENLPYAQPLPAGGENGGLRVVYLGVFSRDRYCLEMIEAFAKHEKDNISFDMIGFSARKDFEKDIHSLMEDLNPSNIRVLPPVDHFQIYNVLSGYDLGLAFYKSSNLNNYYCAPNKVYDYIQMGLAVISNDHPGLIEIVEKNGVGVCLAEVNADSIWGACEAVRQDNLFARSYPETRQRYSWEHQAESYLRLFE